jgi:CheY-like chemotaxis protein
MHLLVVDDDAAVREALALVLGLDGFEVTTAADGREGIRTLSTGRPDAIILDVLMPGIDGLEVCRRIRATGDRTRAPRATCPRSSSTCATASGGDRASECSAIARPPRARWLIYG